MQIKKAVITAAARGSRLFPMADTVQKAMLPIIDGDGIQKNVIQVIAEEAINCGIEDICIICAPGDEERYQTNFERLQKNLSEAFQNQEWAKKESANLKSLMSKLHFKVQEEPNGYGHAILMAKDFIKNDNFLLLHGDYLYTSNDTKSCMQQVIDEAVKNNCSVSSVNMLSEHLISNYGTIKGKHLLNQPGIYDIEKILEKPSLSLAELELQTQGIRLGHYLCFFGIHVFTPNVMEYLYEESQNMDFGKTKLMFTPTLEKLVNKNNYLALEVKGHRYDLSRPYGLFEAQLALVMKGNDKDYVLSKLVSLMAEAAK